MTIEPYTISMEDSMEEKDKCDHDGHGPTSIVHRDYHNAVVKSLREEIERLREGIECYVARPGEGTYECNPNKPCPACRLRVAEALVEELKNELREAKDKIYAIKQTIDNMTFIEIERL
jgi:hypothetical protein